MVSHSVGWGVIAVVATGLFLLVSGSLALLVLGVAHVRRSKASTPKH